MLREIVENGYYSFKESFATWEDAIKASYEPLKKANIVEDIYIDAVIECVNKYGPYIVIVPGIAMPHSTEGAAGCNSTAISFMKVENEVDFDADDPDKKARLFFSLAAVDHEKHIENIQQLMDTLMNEEIVEALYQCKSIEDLKKVADVFESK